MFEYTKNYFDIIKRDLKILAVIFTVINILANIAYPIFAIFVEIGNFYVNVSVLSVSVVYAVAVLIIDKISLEKTKKKHSKRTARNIFGLAKILLGAVSLGIALYSIYISSKSSNGIAIVITSVMIIFWILKVFINIILYLALPRIETFELCLKKDVKPYTDAIDTVCKMQKKDELFNLEDVESEKLKDVVLKSQKITEAKSKKVIKKQIKDDYKNLEVESDLNHDGILEIDEIIQSGLKVEGIQLDKNTFLHHQFGAIYDRKTVKLLEKGKLKTAHITSEELDKYVDDLKTNYECEIKKIRKYVNNGRVDYKNEKDFKKFFKPFSDILIIMQKIIYLYGFPQLDSDKKIPNYQRTALINSFAILLDNDEGVIRAKDNLIKLKKYHLNPDFFRRIKLFFLHKEDNPNELIEDCLPKQAKKDNEVKQID